MSEFNEDEYELECKLIEEEFPNAKFTICIPYNELDDVITSKNEIIIKCDYKCFCYDEIQRPNDFYIVKGECITNRTCIKKLIEEGFNPECNHHFLEGFQQTTDVQFVAMMGS